MVMWPFERKKKLEDGLASLLSISKEEAGVERMTDDVARQLEYITKQVAQGKIMLSEEKKAELIRAIKKLDSKIKEAEFQIKQLAGDVVTLSRRRV